MSISSSLCSPIWPFLLPSLGPWGCSNLSTLSLLRGDQVGVSPLPFWWRLLTDHPSPSTTLLFHRDRVVAGHAVIRGRTELVTRAAPSGQGGRVTRSQPEARGWCSCGPTWEQDWKPLHYPFPSPSFSQTDEHGGWQRALRKDHGVRTSSEAAAHSFPKATTQEKSPLHYLICCFVRLLPSPFLSLYIFLPPSMIFFLLFTST